MWSNRARAGCIIAAPLVTISAASVAADQIGCPPTHRGKPLKDVELFQGPPSDKIELMPRIGRFVVPQPPRELWTSLPSYTLGCTYRGSDDVVTVVLPREVRVCDFTSGRQVRCHP
jgi:hypothetical protein